ncbi:hypothetical protein Pflav_001400 [Phytohabitans flavus]|uniref:Uncharacterized protein n=1 Tax=Phytohabitans flavus TaxID=1076124 RepID=A0A6F8XIT9_9ACTN|nr:hypothetical protein Pflav_001400 [Phytohabitans flavus]
MHAQPVHHRVAALLPHVEVALRVRGERLPAAARRVYAQRDLLGHRAAGEEERFLRAEQAGKAAFELGDRAFRAVRRGLGVDVVEHPAQHRVWHPAVGRVQEEGSAAHPPMVPPTTPVAEPRRRWGVEARRVRPRERRSGPQRTSR